MSKRFNTGIMDKNAESYYVYTLADPFTRKIVYVGITTDIKKRMSHHFRRRTFYDDPIANWLRILKYKGCRPTMNIVSKYRDYETAASMELCLIKKMGSDLLNVKGKPKYPCHE